MRVLVRLVIVVVSIFLGTTLIFWQGTSIAGAELDITATPSITRTLFPTDWNYLPFVQGEVQGPTSTPTVLPPTMTAFPTATNLPATATSTQEPEPTPSPSSTATVTIAPTVTATATATSNPTNTPWPTTTPKPTATPKPTQEPQPTATSAPGNTGDIRITKIFFDGAVFQVESDEYVEIQNFDSKPIKLKGWKLHDDKEIHKYTFPAYTIQPGETCRIYTDENHPEWCGLNWKNGGAIWNNDGDTATLKDGTGKTIDTCKYTGSGTSTTCPPN